MKTVNSDKILFVDVDDTLVIWEGSNYRPHKKHVEFLKRFTNRGQVVIVWSAGGYAWAERIVKELGLEPYVDYVMSKPAWYMDDKRASEFMSEEIRIYFNEGGKDARSSTGQDEKAIGNYQVATDLCSDSFRDTGRLHFKSKVETSDSTDRKNHDSGGNGTVCGAV